MVRTRHIVEGLMPERPATAAVSSERGPGQAVQARARRAHAASPTTPAASRAWRRRQGGFTFTEVMFAVIILGMGFIMLAAIFPVAISQNLSSEQQSKASDIAMAAEADIRHLMRVSTPPETGTAAFQFPVFAPVTAQAPGGWIDTTGIYTTVQGMLIDRSDPRFGWTMLYSRTTGSEVANVIVIVVGSRDAQPYTAARSTASGTAYSDVELAPVGSGSPVANLAPKPITLDLTPGSSGYRLRLSGNSLPAAADGAFVVTTRGKVYRLGAEYERDGSPDSVTFDIEAGYEPTDTRAWNVGGEIGTGIDAYIVGRRLAGTRPADAEYTGAAQDIAVHRFSVKLP